jgi:hypothetical protein
MIWWLPFWLACATIDPLSLCSVCENVALSSFLEGRLGDGCGAHLGAKLDLCAEYYAW